MNINLLEPLQELFNDALFFISENLTKLKKLEYLNLALNNIERVENLDGCESLNKLDLTLNFIGEITSIRSLRKNEFLRDLFLNGNPCTDFKGYREFVVVTLPQVECLDGKPIQHSDRILAKQMFDEITKTIFAEQKKYLSSRNLQKESGGCTITEITEDDDDNDEKTEEEKLQAYWAETSENTPETRVEIADAIRKSKEAKEPTIHVGPPKRVVRFFNKDGRPVNVDQAKVPFTLTEDEDNNCLVLDVSVYKYLDTSLIDVDIQPNYVKVMIKKKALQLVLQEEIKPDSSTAQRSTITGNLVIKMPRFKESTRTKRTISYQVKPADKVGSNPKRELLEIGKGDSMDFSRIVEDAKNRELRKQKVKRDLDEDFVDDPDVPPLE